MSWTRFSDRGRRKKLRDNNYPGEPVQQAQDKKETPLRDPEQRQAIVQGGKDSRLVWTLMGEHVQDSRRKLLPASSTRADATPCDLSPKYLLRLYHRRLPCIHRYLEPRLRAHKTSRHISPEKLQIQQSQHLSHLSSLLSLSMNAEALQHHTEHTLIFSRHTPT